MGETNFDIVSANSINRDGTSVPLTESLVKTVGPGKDFETLDEAMAWVKTIVFVGNTNVRFNLDRITHTMSSGVILRNAWIYIYAETDSGSSDPCIINPSADYPQYNAFFTLVASELTVQNVDIVGDGKLSTETYGGFNFFSGSKGFIWDCDISDCFIAVASYNNSFVVVRGGTFDNCDQGIGSESNSIVRTFITNVTLSNCTTGINCKEGAKVLAGKVTHTTNTADTNVPINEIQYDGAVICNESSALTLKA